MKFSLPVALAILGFVQAAPAPAPPISILPHIARFAPERARRSNSNHEDSGTHPPSPSPTSH